jgi:hypothetical protein
MVHFPPLPSPAYVFSGRYFGMSQSGFPHSEIPGSKPACGSPRLIAACHVLHRLLAPRHSPYALSSLTKCSLHLTYLLSDPKAGLPRICGQKTTHCRIFSCQKTVVLLLMPQPKSRYQTLSAFAASPLRRDSLQHFRGLPSRSPERGGGWWRIPGSNR